MVKIYRPISGRIQISGLRKPQPGEPTNRQWLKDSLGDRIRPTWIEGPNGWDGHWAVARSHLNEVIDALSMRAGAVDIAVEFNIHEQCDTRCQSANGDDCTCSCFGQNHGIQTGNSAYKTWVSVGTTTLISNQVATLSFTRTRADVQRTRF